MAMLIDVPSSKKCGGHHAVGERLDTTKFSRLSKMRIGSGHNSRGNTLTYPTWLGKRQDFVHAFTYVQRVEADASVIGSMKATSNRAIAIIIRGHVLFQHNEYKPNGTSHLSKKKKNKRPRQILARW